MSLWWYNAAWSVATPAIKAYLSGRPRHRPLLQRFAPAPPELPAAPIWLHAVSVGEVRTAQPIVAAMAARWPDIPLLVSASTVTGHALAQKQIRDAAVTWCPFDSRAAVGRFVRAVAPRVLVLLETEFWPNLINETVRFGAPVVLINGRLSDKHYPRYRRIRRLLAPTLQQIALAGVQNALYGQRLESLGVSQKRIRLTGNTKFDGATRTREEHVEALRRSHGIEPEEPIVVFGSTHPGDEKLAVQCFRQLREHWPALRLIIAPRHVQRVDEIAALAGEPVALRSRIQNGLPAKGERVIIVDTIGELTAFFGLATVAVIGGSFFPGIEGHNPLEPAACGVPTVFGPYMKNFEDAARALLDGDGARQVPGPEALANVLKGLLDNAEERTELGQRAVDVIAQNRGAVERNLDLVDEVLAHREHASGS